MNPSPCILPSCITLALAAVLNIVDPKILIKANTICILCYKFI